MTSREKVLAIFNRKGTGEGAMWTGHPNEATVPIYADAWHIEPTREAIFSYLNDDCRWLDADDGYQHPSGRRAIDPAYGVERPTLSAPGCFADAETVADIENTPGRTRRTATLRKFTARLPVFRTRWCSRACGPSSSTTRPTFSAWRTIL